MSSDEAAKAFKSAEDWSRSAQARFSTLGAKPGKDQEAMLALADLARATSEIAKGLREMAK